jgi:hypothetical protein
MHDVLNISGNNSVIRSQLTEGKGVQKMHGMLLRTLL